MKTGLYIHIPFCDAKCAYCDFYSFRGSDELKNEYVKNLLARLSANTGGYDTAYIGGGTPTVLSESQLSVLAKGVAGLTKQGGEFTVEANPARNLTQKLQLLKKAGVNRVSMGLQSANEAELKALSRLHTAQDALDAVAAVKNAGIDNFSLDLMLGIEGQTLQSLDKSIDFVLRTGAKHISCYMLKLERGTPLFENPPPLPEEEAVCEMYLHTVERLKKEGLKQYEISNFAFEGFESRHNLNYWDCGEYLGLGPAAHSFINGERFHFDRDINGFLSGAEPVSDGKGGSFEEYAMLRLRLTAGLERAACEERFEGGNELFDRILGAAQKYKNSGLLIADPQNISLTPNGFLVSNALLADLL